MVQPNLCRRGDSKILENTLLYMRTWESYSPYLNYLDPHDLIPLIPATVPHGGVGPWQKISQYPNRKFSL